MSDMPDYAIKSIRDMPDWRTVIAEDVDVTGGAIAPSGLGTVLISYIVPAGKTLFIYDWSISVSTAECNVHGELANLTDLVSLSYGGGAQGFQVPLTKPKRIEGGKTVRVLGRQFTGANQTLYAHFGGILI